jgi:hypothetical protein
MTVLPATERLPQPMSMIGIVTIDNRQRNLVVSRPDTKRL